MHIYRYTCNCNRDVRSSNLCWNKFTWHILMLSSSNALSISKLLLITANHVRTNAMIKYTPYNNAINTNDNTRKFNLLKRCELA